MQTMILLDDAEEVALVERLWKQMEEEKKNGILDETSYVEGGIHLRDKGWPDIKFGPNAIVYYLSDGADASYTVWNFQTGEKKENVEGDLAGLVNLGFRDFPF